MSLLPTDSSYLTTQVVNQIDEIAALKAENARLRAACEAMAAACQSIADEVNRNDRDGVLIAHEQYAAIRHALALNAKAGT